MYMILQFDCTSLKILQLPAFWDPKSNFRGSKPGGACPQTP